MSTPRPLLALVSALLLNFACGDTVVVEPAANPSSAGGGRRAVDEPPPETDPPLASTNPDDVYEPCDDLLLPVSRVAPPLDVVVVVSTASTMTGELSAIEASIQTEFSDALAASGLDYRLFLIAAHGTGARRLCIGPPLSLAANCSGAPGQNPGTFYHYDVPLDGTSVDPQRVLDAVSGAADLAHLYPTGLAPFFRPDSVKHWIWVTDADPSDEAPPAAEGPWGRGDSGAMPGSVAHVEAQRFEAALAAIDPTTFAPELQVHHAVVGLPAQPNGAPDQRYLPDAPVVTDTCGTATGPNVFSQWLSKLRGAEGGVRFPVCETASYRPVIDYAIQYAPPRLPCELPIPSDLPSWVFEELMYYHYEPGDGGPEVVLQQIWDEDACDEDDDDAFYRDDGVDILCPETCERIASDGGGRLFFVAACVDSVP